MFWIVVLTVLNIFYIVFSLIQILSPTFQPTNLILILSGFIGMVFSLFKQLYQNSLTFYLYWHKLTNWMRNYPAKWNLAIRFDGTFSTNVIQDVDWFIHNNLNYLKKSKTHYKTNNSINFTVNDTLSFYIDYLPKDFSNYEYDTLDISLHPFEIGCNSSKGKLETEIIPFLTQLQDKFKPDNSSYVLNISFLTQNPFFAVFIAHLSPKLVNSFNINLQIDEYNKTTCKDIVTINKDNVIVNANSVYALKELANDFIYLSSHVKQYIRPTVNA